MSELDDLFDRMLEEDDIEPMSPKCRRCGSSDVRWRQQGGRWVLFSLTPGVEHVCKSSDLADDFDELD